MNLSVVLWGVEKPSRTRQVVLVITFAVLALTFTGFWADFVPAESWNNVVLVISGVFAAVTLGALLRSSTPARELSLSKRALRASGYLTIPLVAFGFGWVSLSNGVGHLATIAAGHESSQVVWAQKINDPGRRRCWHRLEGPAFARAIPSHLCISRGDYEQLPKEGNVRLVGMESWFGFSVKSWRVER